MKNVSEKDQFYENVAVFPPQEKNGKKTKSKPYIDFPDNLDVEFKDVESDIKKYRIFMSNSKIFIRSANSSDIDHLIPI